MIPIRCKACSQRFEVDDELAGQEIDCNACGETIEIPYPPLELPEEVTEGGSVVHRHEDVRREFEIAVDNEENINRISNHIEKHLAPVATVFHEIVSELVHIDVHCIPASDDRPYITLITSGMSDRPMSPPPEAKQYSYAELMICLPPDWPIKQESFRDENNYWPIRWLKRLARFPHEYDTWLFEGHTIPSGDPPEPFAENTQFCGWLLFPPLLVPDEFRELRVDSEKTIRFFAIFPLYEQEMEFKLSAGMDALIDRFAQHGVTELVDVTRPNTCKT